MRTPLGKRFGGLALGNGVVALYGCWLWFQHRDFYLPMVIWGVAALVMLVLMGLAESGRIGQNGAAATESFVQRRAMAVVYGVFILFLLALFIWSYFRPNGV